MLRQGDKYIWAVAAVMMRCSHPLLNIKIGDHTLFFFRSEFDKKAGTADHNSRRESYQNDPGGHHKGQKEK